MENDGWDVMGALGLVSENHWMARVVRGEVLWFTALLDNSDDSTPSEELDNSLLALLIFRFYFSFLLGRVGYIYLPILIFQGQTKIQFWIDDQIYGDQKERGGHHDPLRSEKIRIGDLTEKVGGEIVDVFCCFTMSDEC